MRGNRGFVIIGNAHAIGGNWETAYFYDNYLLVDTKARLTNGHNDRSPICVFTGNGGFNKWRIGNGQTNMPGLMI